MFMMASMPTAWASVRSAGAGRRRSILRPRVFWISALEFVEAALAHHHLGDLDGVLQLDEGEVRIVGDEEGEVAAGGFSAGRG